MVSKERKNRRKKKERSEEQWEDELENLKRMYEYDERKKSKLEEKE